MGTRLYTRDSGDHLGAKKASTVENDVHHGSEGVRETWCEVLDWIHLADVNMLIKLNVL